MREIKKEGATERWRGEPTKKDESASEINEVQIVI